MGMKELVDQMLAELDGVPPQPSRGAPLLRELVRTGMRARALLEEELAPLELSPLEVEVLSLLSNQGSLPEGQLAQELWTARQSVHRVLARLRAAGLVEARPSDTDRRALLNTCTERGAARLSDALRLIDDLEDRVLCSVHRDDREHVAGMLERATDCIRYEERRRLWALIQQRYW